MRFEVAKDVELSVSYPLNVLDLEEMVSSSPKVLGKSFPCYF